MRRKEVALALHGAAWPGRQPPAPNGVATDAARTPRHPRPESYPPPPNSNSVFQEAADLRYSRQVRFAPLGDEGQANLRRATVLVVGCGALGSVIAELLARAGIGRLRIVDRDFLELHNLQRQSLYDEHDVLDALPKAIAAARRIARINGHVQVEPIVADLHAGNIEQYATEVDVIADGTDNFETRFLINDLSHAARIPWVFGGCVGARGQTMTILPGRTPCLRCLQLDVPEPGTMATCDSEGVLGPVVQLIGSLQAMEVLKIASRRSEATSPFLQVYDLWNNQMRQIRVTRDIAQECPTCHRGEFDWLRGARATQGVALCGRNAVQLQRMQSQPVDLERLARSLHGLPILAQNPFLIRVAVDEFEVTVFADSRVIVGGTQDIPRAKMVATRVLGG